MGRTPVTEHYLRSWFNNLDKPEFFQLEPGMLLTPAGLQFLQDNKIALQRISDQGQRIVAGHDGPMGSEPAAIARRTVPSNGQLSLRV